MIWARSLEPTDSKNLIKNQQQQQIEQVVVIQKSYHFFIVHVVSFDF
jgi:alpha/beta superfamily hydrolase